LPPPSSNHATAAELFDLFGNSVLFSSLDAETMQKLGRQVRWRGYSRGAVVDLPDTSSVHVVARGVVRLSLVSEGGRELGLGQREEGEIFESGASGGPGATLGYALADGTCVATFAEAQLVAALEDCPAALLALANHRRTEMERAQTLIAELAFFDLRGRLARRLLDLAIDHVVVRTHEDLARDVGARPEQVTKALQALREAELIAYPPHGRAIRLVDPSGLASSSRSAGEPRAAHSGRASRRP